MRRKLDAGTYWLHIWLPRDQRIRVGVLGTFDFPRGQYVYVGSALNGVTARITRHLRDDKRLHWHIDYLLQRAFVERTGSVKSTRRLECIIARSFLRRKGARVIVPRFGASDCKCNCRAHLIYFGNCAKLFSPTPL